MSFNLMNTLAIFLFFSFGSRVVLTQGGVYDVTSPKYGAKPNSDITLALANAWKDACASIVPSKLVIPKGIYKLKEAALTGPCKAPIVFLIQGTVQAPADGAQMTKPDTWIGFRYIDRLTLTGGGIFDGQGALAWKQNDCHKNKNCKSIINLRFDYITNSLIKGVTSLNSKNFHVNVLGCKSLTFEQFTVTAPGESINTDGIHIGRSSRINITDSNIKTGDDCISIGDGTTELTITKVTCGPGHGISIGSLGRYPNEAPVAGIIVRNCTISNTDNGVRIKTWPALEGGSVSGVHFEDIIMVNVGNPIIIDQEYCPYNQCNKQAPSKVKISDVYIKNIRGTSSTAEALKIACSKGFPCQKVEISDVNLRYTGNQGPMTSVCSNVKPVITRVPPTLACAKRA